jgi:hypothetical protein
MNVADDIRKLGFRRWYERQLIEGFAYMVTAFLALILLLAGYESLDQLRSMPGFYLTVFVAAAAAGMLTIVGFRRFGVLLSRAEQFANDAECPQCKAWGKFDVVSRSRSPRTTRSKAGGRIGCGCAVASATTAGASAEQAVTLDQKNAAPKRRVLLLANRACCAQMQSAF